MLRVLAVSAYPYFWKIPYQRIAVSVSMYLYPAVSVQRSLPGIGELRRWHGGGSETWLSRSASDRAAPCSLGLSATSQQYFSLRTNQPLATSQQYFSLRTNQHQPSATSQANRLLVGCRPPAASATTKRRLSGSTVLNVDGGKPLIYS
jgi:hypothetical protein